MQAYGPRGWWPLVELRHRLPAAGGYHPGDYRPPATQAERFEVGVGAILTQNTAWKQVEGCLDTLQRLGGLEPAALLKLDAVEIAAAIRSSGYFRQKSRKLLGYARFFLHWDPKPPPRPELLALWGIGEETADSILLYAYGRPFFVVDAYSRRLVARLTGVPVPAYSRLQQYFAAPFMDMDPASRAIVFNEFHALVVTVAKAHCRRQPLCRGCPLESVCLSAEKT